MTVRHFFRRPETLRRFREGPLGPYVDAYAELLHAENYTRWTARQQIRSVAQFSHWLKDRGIRFEDVRREHFEDYPRSRLRWVRPALERFMRLAFPRNHCAEQPKPRVDGTIESVTEDFARFLLQERGLASGTCRYYVRFAEGFLRQQSGTGPLDLTRLSAAQIAGFVQAEAVCLSKGRVGLITAALRSFLRFAYYRGHLPRDLAGCVPPVAHWAQASLPKYLSPHQVQRVLSHCDRLTARGKRDYAILLLLARLGLRAGEVAALRLEDIDWHTGVLTVQSKGGHLRQYPLLRDIGAAVADYLQDGRPKSGERVLFLRAVAPVKALHGQAAISSIVKAVLKRAGVQTPRQGAHVFRHTLATTLLRQGASLTEVGTVLGHQSPTTTALYAKVDMDSLRSIAPTWPGGER